MSCGSSVLPLIVPAVPGDEIVQGTRKLREDLFLHLKAPIEVIEMFAQERLGCRVFSSYVPSLDSFNMSSTTAHDNSQDLHVSRICISAPDISTSPTTTG